MDKKSFFKFVVVTVSISIAVTFTWFVVWARSGKFLDGNKLAGEIVTAGIEVTDGKFSGNFHPETPVDYKLTTNVPATYKITSNWTFDGGGGGSEDWLYTIRLSFHRTVSVKVYNNSGTLEMELYLRDKQEQYITSYTDNVSTDYFVIDSEFNEIVEKYGLKDDVDELAKITDKKYPVRVGLKHEFTFPIWLP